MADITNSQEHQESPSSKKDIQDLKEDLQTFFKTSMAELLTPVQAKLDELTEGLGAAGRAAASALDTAESLQTEVMTLKRSEALLQTKISTLENRWRQFNLKFRGIEEGTEQASDLKMGLLLLKNLNVVMTQEETEALQGHPAFEEVQPLGE
ncbi:UNVERIFIED_CONTAM: hypothetical protein K2H54_060464 [Gekko kuhli]